MSPETKENEPQQRSGRLPALAETVLILLLFFIVAGDTVPGNDEAHYLPKAKHYWNPGWCPNDHFLNSADAHQVFTWTFGWLTLWFPLSAVAWMGRVLAWGFLAWSWRRLSFALVPKPMFALLSAGLFLTLSQRCQLAREWVVGGFEAKEIAYAFVWLALEAIVRNRWNRAWLFLGVGSSFHVIVGGWSVLACVVTWLLAGKDRPKAWSQAPALAGGLLLALPGLLPAVALTWGVDRETISQANEIYVFARLSHHLVPHGFEASRIVSHLALLIAWIGLAIYVRIDEPQRRLQGFVLGAVIITLAGWLIDLSLLSHPRLAAAVLRYYWFRLVDASLPMGVSLALLGIVYRMEPKRPVTAQWAAAALLLAAGLNLGISCYSKRLDPRSGADIQGLPVRGVNPEQTRDQIDREWRATCQWIALHTPPDAMFLTPRRQQTFKWNTGRGEVFCWKDVPQDAGGLVEWDKRRQRIFPDPPSSSDADLLRHSDDELVQICRNYGADYFVVDRTRSRRRPQFVRVYPRFSEYPPIYEVFDVRQRVSEAPRPSHLEADVLPQEK